MLEACRSAGVARGGGLRMYEMDEALRLLLLQIRSFFQQCAMQQSAQLEALVRQQEAWLRKAELRWAIEDARWAQEREERKAAKKARRAAAVPVADV